MSYYTVYYRSCTKKGDQKFTSHSPSLIMREMKKESRIGRCHSPGGFATDIMEIRIPYKVELPDGTGITWDDFKVQVARKKLTPLEDKGKKGFSVDDKSVCILRILKMGLVPEMRDIKCSSLHQVYILGRRYPKRPSAMKIAEKKFHSAECAHEVIFYSSPETKVEMKWEDFNKSRKYLIKRV